MAHLTLTIRFAPAAPATVLQLIYAGKVLKDASVRLADILPQVTLLNQLFGVWGCVIKAGGSYDACVLPWRNAAR